MLINDTYVFEHQLTPMRPRRPDSENRSRPPSDSFKQGRPITPSATAFVGALVMEDNDEPPPPLPEKSTAHADYANVGANSTQGAGDAITGGPPPLIRRGTHRDRVILRLLII
jgi:hypothetical protein